MTKRAARCLLHLRRPSYGESSLLPLAAGRHLRDFCDDLLRKITFFTVTNQLRRSIYGLYPPESSIRSRVKCIYDFGRFAPYFERP